MLSLKSKGFQVKVWKGEEQRKLRQAEKANTDKRMKKVMGLIMYN